jgi:glycosyltransferase involved in cell wall biosynthesis
MTPDAKTPDAMTPGELPPAQPSRDPLTLCFLGDPDSVHVRRWAGWFAARGHRVSILVPTGRSIAPDLPAAIRVERFVPYWRHRVRPIGALEARRSLRSVLSRLAPDVLHAHYLTVHGWLARLSGYHPYAVTVWGSDILITAPRNVRTRLFARLALGAADLVTGDSAELVRAAVAAGAHPDRTLEVQFGVDPVRFAPGPALDDLRTRLGVAGRRVIFAPRTIAPLYRQDVLVKALVGLPEDVAVVMTRHRAEPESVADLERLAAGLGIADRLRIVPTIEHDDMADVFRIADVVVSIPANDGTPVSLLEAMAVGRPIVATDLPSVREWLAEIDPGALVPVGDVASTTRAIQSALARPPDERERRSAQGRDLVLRRANHEASMAGVESLYRRLAHRR